MGASGHASGRTGLSACIFFATGKKGYRFNPLRVAGAATDKPRVNAEEYEPQGAQRNHMRGNIRLGMLTNEVAAHSGMT
jgi:hypothetical protein